MVEKPENWPYAFRTAYEKDISFNYSIDYPTDKRDFLVDRIGGPEDTSQVEEYGVREICRLSEYLALDEEVVRTAERVYLRAISTDLTYNYSIADLTATSIYAACKEMDDLRSAAEIFGGSIMANQNYLPARIRLDRPSEDQIGANGNAIYAPPPKAGSPVRKLYSELSKKSTIEMSFSQYKAKDFLHRYASLLDLESSVIEAAMTCIEKFEKQLGSRSPSSKAAISIWYTVDYLQFEIKLRDITLATGYNMTFISHEKNSL